jgi:hypothetical protein
MFFLNKVSELILITKNRQLIILQKHSELGETVVQFIAQPKILDGHYLQSLENYAKSYMPN